MSHALSDLFKRELKYSHQVATKIELWVDGVYSRDLIAHEGNVRIADKEIRRRAEVSVLNPDYDLVPGNLLDPLAPVGNEIRIYRGLYLSNGETEMVQLGAFTIDDVRVDESGDGHQLRLDCFDYGHRVQRFKFTEDYVISAGTTVREAIEDMVREAVPDAHFHIEDDLDEVLPARFYAAGKDRWAAARALALNVGGEVYFNEHGGCVMRRVTSALEEPVWSFDVTQDDHTLLYINKRLHNQETYNHVIVSGESTDNTLPVRAEAMDTNPASPTYVYGKYGRVTYHHESSQISSVAQAQAVADALLAKGLGSTETIDLTNLVHPGLDVGDNIYVNVPKTKTSSIYTIDSITIPLVAIRGMNIGCRERIVV